MMIEYGVCLHFGCIVIHQTKFIRAQLALSSVEFYQYIALIFVPLCVVFQFFIIVFAFCRYCF